MKIGTRSVHAVDQTVGGFLHVAGHVNRLIPPLADWPRVAVKGAILFVVLYAARYVLYPVQRDGWLLWLGEDKRALAEATAFALVSFTMLILAGVGYAWRHGTRHVATAGLIVALMMMFTVLLGSANFYVAESLKSVTVSQALAGGASGRVEEAQKALTDFHAATASSLAAIDKGIADTPADSPTGRSRLVKQRSAMAMAAVGQEASLRQELLAARSANVTAQAAAPDPRPLDGVAAKLLHWAGVSRKAAAVFFDVFRSVTIELAVLVFASIGLAFVESAGDFMVRRDEEFRETKPGLLLSDHRAERPVYTPQDAAKDVADLMMANGADPRFAADMARSASDAKPVETEMYDKETGDRIIMRKAHEVRLKPRKKKDGLQTAELDTSAIELPDETGFASPSDDRAAPWASNYMEEQSDDPDRGVDAVDGDGAGLSGGLDSGDAPGAVAAVDDRGPEQAVEKIPLEREEFEARVAAKLITRSGHDIIDHDEDYGPWLPGPLPESHQLPAPEHEEEDA